MTPWWEEQDDYVCRALDACARRVVTNTGAGLREWHTERWDYRKLFDTLVGEQRGRYLRPLPSNMLPGNRWLYRLRQVSRASEGAATQIVLIGERDPLLGTWVLTPDPFDRILRCGPRQNGFEDEALPWLAELDPDRLTWLTHVAEMAGSGTVTADTMVAMGYPPHLVTWARVL